MREYDPIIGRWLIPDPYRQHWSPYVGMGNNPVNRVDPDGGCDDCPKPGSLNSSGTATWGLNGITGQYEWVPVLNEVMVYSNDVAPSRLFLDNLNINPAPMDATRYVINWAPYRSPAKKRGGMTLFMEGYGAGQQFLMRDGTSDGDLSTFAEFWEEMGRLGYSLQEIADLFDIFFNMEESRPVITPVT